MSGSQGPGAAGVLSSHCACVIPRLATSSLHLPLSYAVLSGWQRRGFTAVDTCGAH